MSNPITCPLGDSTKCALEASLELSGERGLVQQNCRTCGEGKSVCLPLAAALELHDELHRHRDPPPASDDVPQGTPPTGTPAGIPAAAPAE